ncbi:hypothetical protein JB92DRAFT_3107282 [Gautieria morchelliformis]|nr:hypothetical protein JB92DRAFT_3107282 [Gautieria morchelliformis]
MKRSSATTSVAEEPPPTRTSIASHVLVPHMQHYMLNDPVGIAEGSEFVFEGEGDKSPDWEAGNVVIRILSGKKKGGQPNLNALGAIQTCLLPPLIALLLPVQDAYNDVACLPVGALVALTLEHELAALGKAHRDVEHVVLRVQNEHVGYVWMCKLEAAPEPRKWLQEDLFQLDTESQDREKGR